MHARMHTHAHTHNHTRHTHTKHHTTHTHHHTKNHNQHGFLDFLMSSMKDEGTTLEQRREQTRLNQLKDQLNLLLRKPLLPVGFSPSYPTFGGHNLTASVLQ